MQRIRNIADDFFAKQELKLPLDFGQLKKTIRDMKWEIYAYSESKELINYLESRGHTKIRNYDGFTYRSDNSSPSIILYRDDLSYRKKIKIICHEIGHIVLDHSSNDGILGKSGSRRAETEQEKEADIFALEFQAPIPVLRQMDLTSLSGIDKNGILTIGDALKQLIYMRMQTISNVKGYIITVVLIFAALWIGTMLKQQNAIGGGNVVAETISQEIEKSFEIDEEKKTQIVCITQSGEKYHKPDCRYVTYYFVAVTPDSNETIVFIGILSAVESSNNITYYKDYPSVPDFGAFANLKLTSSSAGDYGTYYFYNICSSEHSPIIAYY